ncbi:Aldolase/RraA-like protein 2 [Elsinoe fawcettii]|nr:Aldolase/RraA-like protein 2 [Elsinoe fawcettii]
MSRLISALRPFASCDIGDALVKLKYPFGGFLDGISMWSPHRQGHNSADSPTIIGQAVTVKMIDAKDITSPKPAKHFIDYSEAGKIMYISQPSSMHSACFGGLMGTRAKVMDAAGVVIDGRFRDIAEIQSMELPLFAKGTSILGSNTFTRASEINVPLQYKDDLWINPDDILVGDQDGVVVVPPSLVDQVVAICADRKKVDEKTMKALEAGDEMGPTLQRLRK